MTTSKQYDYLNRLGSVSSTPSHAFAYTYNAANQRTMNRQADGSYWRYGYDALGQAISGNKFWVDQTPVAGQQFDYAFDTIRNRTLTEAGGDQNGANLRAATYTHNTLNQITSRVVPGYVDIMGDGIATNAVTVNGQTAYRKVEYFRQQLAVNNSSSNLWTNITVAEGGGSVSGNLYVPQTPETCSYDAEGNLLSDGRWTYSWDGENRLVGMTSLTNAPSVSKLQLAFTYDYRGRRIQKIVSTNNGSAYVGEYTNNYAYDGWNCIALLNSSSSLLNSFQWGLDLSGSMQGAGGVGGLLAENIVGDGVQFVTLDGNGNVSALVNATNGITIANYEYGPFGEVIRMTGPRAKLNPFRFSTKFDDDETDLLYYGHRYYNPSTGRWPNRDPLGQIVGGNNLYEFIANDAINQLDAFGLAVVSKGPTGGTVVTISPCEIVLYIGHGNSSAKDPTFVVPGHGKKCGAGFIGCFANPINQKIAKKPGCQLIPGSPITKGSDTTWDDLINPFNNPDWNNALQNMQKGIPSLVNQLLASGCPSVTVTVIGVNGIPISTTYTTPLTTYTIPQ